MLRVCVECCVCIHQTSLDICSDCRGTRVMRYPCIHSLLSQWAEQLDEQPHKYLLFRLQNARTMKQGLNSKVSALSHVIRLVYELVSFPGRLLAVWKLLIVLFSIILAVRYSWLLIENYRFSCHVSFIDFYRKLIMDCSVWEVNAAWRIGQSFMLDYDTAKILYMYCENKHFQWNWC